MEMNIEEIKVFGSLILEPFKISRDSYLRLLTPLSRSKFLNKVIMKLLYILEDDSIR